MASRRDDTSRGDYFRTNRWDYQRSRRTGVGNPELATKGKGEKFFIAVTQKIGDVLYELSKSDIENLYE